MQKFLLRHSFLCCLCKWKSLNRRIFAWKRRQHPWSWQIIKKSANKSLHKWLRPYRKHVIAPRSKRQFLRSFREYSTSLCLCIWMALNSQATRWVWESWNQQIEWMEVISNNHSYVKGSFWHCWLLVVLKRYWCISCWWRGSFFDISALYDAQWGLW